MVLDRAYLRANPTAELSYENRVCTPPIRACRARPIRLPAYLTETCLLLILTACCCSVDGRLLQYMVFACADSRVCPSVTLRLEPGEAFTIRNIAAMVPGYDKNRYAGVGSAIEYAVCALGVEVLVVIGHSKCGGIKALLSLQDGASDTFHFVEDWVRIGYPAKKKVQTDCASLSFDDQCSALEKEAVNVSLENLKTYPFVEEGLANGTLKLVGGHYDFVNGVFSTWQPE